MTDADADDGDGGYLERALAIALERLATGSTCDVAALTRERPHLRQALADALELRGILEPATPMAADPSTTGELTERYELRAVIGRGAAGIVHRAFDRSLQREVAIKLLNAGWLGTTAAERFAREARILARLPHPHIVRIYDHGETHDGRQFLVMELLTGHCLQTVLQQARAAMPSGPDAAAFRRAPWLRELLPAARFESSYLRQVVRWVAQLGSGLAAAHDAAVFHRDVKPGNAFVRADGSAVLLDFGIAARAADAALTVDRAFVGTPSYMAPEQAEGRAALAPTLDVYGLAATLYHLLTLRPPHEGGVGEVLPRLLREDPRPANTLHRGLPRDLQAILDQGLARRPADRYPTMAALVADLEAFLDNMPVGARPIGPLRRQWRRLRRHGTRTLAVTASIATVAVTLVAVPAFRALAAADRDSERAALLAHLPGDLAIEGWPGERLLVPLGEQRGLLRELDHLLALEPGDLSTRLLRAALLLDSRQRDAARGDLELLATQHDSPYLRALAARYAAAASTAVDGAVDLAGLPEPSTPADCFVAGFHALRARDSRAAAELLARAGAFPPARDLHLLAMLDQQPPDPEAIVAEAGRLEGVYGRPTARTRHALGAAMLMLRRWEKAIPYCEAALALRPDRHGPWNNLGLAHLRLGHLEQARDCYRRAVAIRPWFPNSRSGLCQTLRGLGDLDGARTEAAAIEDPCWREHELGNIDVVASLAARRRHDGDAQRRLADSAAAHFAAAAATAAATRDPKAASLPSSAAYAKALAADDVAAVLGAFVDTLRGEPRNAQQLANLADLLGGRDVDARLRERLRLLLLEQAIDLAPDDASIRALRDKVRDALRQADSRQPR